MKEIIYCKITQKEPKRIVKETSTFVVREPHPIYVGKTSDEKTVLIDEDASEPLNLKIGDNVEIERTKFLGLIPKDKIVYQGGVKRHIYMRFLK